MLAVELKNRTVYLLGLFSIGLFLFAVRVYGLEHAPLFDYDSVKNYLLAEQLAALNFSNVFHHASPSLNLLNGFLFYFFKDHVYLQCVNAFFNVLAILLLGDCLSKNLNWKTVETFFYVLVAGTSLTMVNTSRFLGMESLSLLCFVIFLRVYLASFSLDKKSLLMPGFLLGLLFTINYKAILVLPVIFLIECLAYKKEFIKRCSLGLLGFCIPCIIYIIGSVFIPSMFLKYPATLYCIMFMPDDHPYKDLGFFNMDLMYYVKYFFYYEGPVLIVGLLLYPLLYLRKLSFFRRDYSLEVILGVMVYSFVFGMSLLQKAPRGLLFIYPLMYASVVMIIIRFFSKRKWVMVGLFLMIVIYNMIAVEKNIYQYAHADYTPLRKYLRDHKISNMASYVSMQAYPFVEDEIKDFKVLHHENEIMHLKEDGVSYLFVDDYYRLTCMQLNIPVTHQLVFEYEDPAMCSPLLALEHSEYSGLSFEETLKIRGQIIADRPKMKLYRLFAK